MSIQLVLLGLEDRLGSSLLAIVRLGDNRWFNFLFIIGAC
jgi:hypothetical protein